MHCWREVFIKFTPRVIFADTWSVFERLANSFENVLPFQVSSVCVIIDGDRRMQIDSNITF